MAAALTCPYCSHSIVPDDEAPPAERCPSCAGELLIAYRYQLVRARGKIAGGVLYEAIDSGFAQPMAVLFVEDPNDREASERFIAGHRLFANLRTRGLVTIHEVSRPNHRRPHVVMDWLAGSTLDRHVGKVGPLDPTLVWAMTSNLLIGFERAHRALPALVHGQVHPGKIGFRSAANEGGVAVLYGFEWAHLVSEQDSSLADSFSADADVERERASSLDLRALARTIIYAATGRWIEDAPMERQRQQAAAMMPGPMAPFLDRMLAAGTPHGYKSTSVARDEFELIRAGGERRRPPQGGERRAAPSPISKGEFAGMAKPSPIVEVDDVDEYVDDDDDHEPASAYSSTLVEQVRQRQAQLAARASISVSEPVSPPAKSKAGFIVALAIGGLMFASVIAGLEDDSTSPTPPPPTFQSPPVVQPIPDWSVVEAEPELAPEPIVLPPTFAARTWSAKVETAFKGNVKPPIKAGSKCELWVAPTDDSSSFSCRWAVDCKERDGWTRYYGNGSSGFGHCTLEGDKVVYVADLQDDDGDGLMVFDASAEQPWALIGDRFADPPRVVLLRFDAEGKLAEQPSQPEARPLERLGFAQLDQAEYAAAGRLLDQLGADMELALDFAADEADEADEALPKTLDIFTLQSTIDGIQSDLLACSAPAGTKVDVDLTVEGSTGIASSIELANTSDGDHDLCLRIVLATVEFDRFTDETLDVSWTISW